MNFKPKKFRLQGWGDNRLFFETNLAKNISPSPKGLMGFISFGGYIFVGGWGLNSPFNPLQAHAWLYVPGFM